MQKLAFLILLVGMLAGPGSADPQADIDKALDDFHAAAAAADASRYFGHFTEDAVFIGTDITERWSVPDFKAYAMPHFSQGEGWTYKPVSRHVYLAEDGKTAWFDETLENASYGLTRGSGVLVDQGGQWKLAQYHLTLPVPNEIVDDVVKMIRTQSSGF